MISGIASPPSVTSLVSKTTQPAADSSPNLVKGDSMSLGSSDAQPAKGPSPFDVVRSNAPSIGAMAGAGVGLALGLTGGGGLFVSTLCGTIGGVICGNVIKSS